MKPIAKLVTMMIPKWIGSTPSAVTTWALFLFFCACHMGPVSVIVVRRCPPIDEIPKSDDAVCWYGKIRHRRDACVQYGNADAFSCGE